MKFTPQPSYSLASFFEYQGETLPFERLITCSVGYDGIFYGVISLQVPELRVTAPSGASFPVTVPSKKNLLRIFALQKNQVLFDLEIEVALNIHFIEPLPNGFLLACGRSRASDASEQNGRIYDLQGNFVRKIMLGDGIQNIHTTQEGHLWITYFDEGVFGDCPLACHGLVQLDQNGEILYTLDRASFSDMADCYALNVMNSSNIWFYYYTPFDLVHLKDGKPHQVLRSPIQGASCFAVLDDHIAFSGEYSQSPTKITILHINNTSALVKKNTIKIDVELSKRMFYFARKNYFYYVTNKEVYQVNLEDLIQLT